MNQFIPVINFTKSNQSTIAKYSHWEVEKDLHAPRTEAPGVTCHDVRTDNTKWVVGNTTPYEKDIQRCEYYYPLLKNVYGCIKCRHGYSGNVVNLVKQCEVYQKEGECMKCVQGHYLKSKFECIKVEEVKNCIEYDPKDDKTTCTRCHNDFYLTNNACVKRVNTYKKENAVIAIDDDVLVCEEFYHIILGDCVEYPKNCKTVNVVNNVMTCTVCKENSYLDGTVCRVGTIDKCEEYVANSNTCAKCENNYFLRNNNKECTQHPITDPLCASWNTTTKNQCDQCTQDSIKFEMVNKCLDVINQDQNCKVWKDPYRCVECNDGFYLNNVSRTCLTIPNELNCL